LIALETPEVIATLDAMSVSFAQSKLKQIQRELERHREKQAAEEARAARLDGDAAKYEEQASRASPTTARSRLQSAHRKHDEARRARNSAAKASKAVSDTQKKLHQVEADLAKEIGRERKRADDKATRERARAQRDREAEERRQQERDRARDRELASLRGRAEELEGRIRGAPWAASPSEIDVLFISAAPEDQEPLRLDHEVREIQERIRMSKYRDAVRFHWRPATRVTDLFQALNEVRPHVVHFSGHGDQDDLIFEDSDGYSKALGTSDLAQLLHISSDRIRLAVFNSCNSALQAERACEHIDAAIGMDRPVEDVAAKVFAGQLYNALGFGKSLEEAFEQARLQVKLTGGDGGDPILYTTPGAVAAEIYLVKPPDAHEDAA
jgi:hypothetical protein